MATVAAVCIGKARGEVKLPVDEIKLIVNYGIDGDAHAGAGKRQVSILASESVDKIREKVPRIKDGDFAENILTKGICLHELPIGTKLSIGEVLLEVTKIGKNCHNDGCEIRRQVGDCVMPREGIFAAVLKAGIINKGMEIIDETPKFAHPHNIC